MPKPAGADGAAGTVNVQGLLGALHACPHIGSLLQATAVTVYVPTGMPVRLSEKPKLPVGSGGILVAVMLDGSPRTLKLKVSPVLGGV
jgi:hypothetical protein